MGGSHFGSYFGSHGGGGGEGGGGLTSQPAGFVVVSNVVADLTPTLAIGELNGPIVFVRSSPESSTLNVVPSHSVTT